MARSADAVKLLAWQQRLQRYSRSRLTVAQFCAKESVSVPSFYHWKRKLHGVADKPATIAGKSGRLQPARPAASAFKRVFVTTPVHVPATTIRLPGGIVVELGHDLPMIEQTIGQLLAHQAGRGADGC
jgi:hypothetical protein